MKSQVGTAVLDSHGQEPIEIADIQGNASSGLPDTEANFSLQARACNMLKSGQLDTWSRQRLSCHAQHLRPLQWHL